MKQKKIKKIKLNKKIIVATAVLFVSILGMMGLRAVYAALVDSDMVANDFQIGNLKGEITEKFVPPTETKPIKIGEKYEKEVKVTNTENTPFFVRVLVTPEIQSEEGVLLPSEIGKELLVDLNPDWVLGEDGFYYYLKKVSEKEATTALFHSVTLNSDLATDQEANYEKATMSMSVKSETVTSSGNNYRQAWWQGKVPTEKNLKQIDSDLQKIVEGGK